jgi:hypothetical protein
VRTAVSLVVVVVCAVLGLTGIGPGGASESRPELVLVSPGVPTTTTSTTEAPGRFVDGQVVEFGTGAATPPPPSTTTTTAVPGRTWTWDQLADCETGVWGPGKVPVPGSARWAATRGVYQGGLQFDARTWDSYRERAFPTFPADAHLATREQQIEVAERVLAAQGAKAWPTCGPRVGMTGTGSASAPALPPAGPPENEPD